jgi:hypothetical protein
MYVRNDALAVMNLVKAGTDLPDTITRILRRWHSAAKQFVETAVGFDCIREKTHMD